MRNFNYSSTEEVNYFKRLEEDLKEEFKESDIVNIVKPNEYVTREADTPSGYDLFEEEGIHYRCQINKDNHENLIVENCVFVSGLKCNIEDGDLLRHLAGAGFLINKVTEE